MAAGPVDVTVNFLSPVEPDDLVRQSMPFSYMTVSAAANDGGSHSVSLYTDISAEWVSGDDSQTVNWTTTTGDIITHQVQLETQTEFGEANDRIQRESSRIQAFLLSNDGRRGVGVLLAFDSKLNMKLSIQQSSHFHPGIWNHLPNGSRCCCSCRLCGKRSP